MKGISFFSNIPGEVLSIFKDPLKKETCAKKSFHTVRERQRINVWLSFVNTERSHSTTAASTDPTYKCWGFSVSGRIRWNKVTQFVLKKNTKKQVWSRSTACASSQTSSDSNLEAVQTKCGCESGQKHGKMPKCRWMLMWFTYLSLHHVAVWSFFRTRHQQETGSTNTSGLYSLCLNPEYSSVIRKECQQNGNRQKWVLIWTKRSEQVAHGGSKSSLVKPVLPETIPFHGFVPTKNKEYFFPSTPRPLIPGDLCCLVPFCTLSPLPLVMCPGPWGYSGPRGVSALAAPLDPGYQSFIYSLISWSRSSLGLAPCGRERVQVPAGPLSQHRTQPGYTPIHTEKKSTWWKMNTRVKEMLLLFFLQAQPNKTSTKPAGLMSIRSAGSLLVCCRVECESWETLSWTDSAVKNQVQLDVHPTATDITTN